MKFQNNKTGQMHREAVREKKNLSNADDDDDEDKRTGQLSALNGQKVNESWRTQSHRTPSSVQVSSSVGLG
ncbi:hypothetical protein V5799_003357 [Amblyomma americanum]|uniref:Uncharacterized protein n=1 Tax=Amblyomma americanum TaxID=6943 RepID=A0AAQ4D970_AMBAM